MLVTGANGLLATNVIAELVSKGYRVRGMIRDRRKFLLSAPQVELVEGDITDAAAVESAVKGCEAIVHATAVTDQNILTYAGYAAVNVQGTENILQAAIVHGIKKIVYVGTANTFGYGTVPDPGDETRPFRWPFDRTFYSTSKLEAQNRLFAAAGKFPAPEIVSANPTFMIGPYDAKPSSGQIILMGYGKKVVFHPSGGKNFVHVKDVAKGICNALEKGRNGEAYILGNENMSYREFFQLLNRVTGSKSLLIKIPDGLLLAVGYFGDLLRKAGIKTALSSANMKTLIVHSYYSNKKAKEALGLSFTPVSSAIHEAIHWFREQKMI